MISFFSEAPEVEPPEMHCEECQAILAASALTRYQQDYGFRVADLNPAVKYGVRIRFKERQVLVQFEGYPVTTYTFEDLGFNGCGAD